MLASAECFFAQRTYVLSIASREGRIPELQRQRLERRAQKLIATECSNDSCPDYSIYAVFGYAIAIHIYYFLRNVPRGAPFFHLMSSRIRERLEKVNLVMLQFQYPEMVLWILVMAGRRYWVPESTIFCTSVCGHVQRLWNTWSIRDSCEYGGAILE